MDLSMKTWNRIYQQQIELEKYKQAVAAQSAAAAAALAQQHSLNAAGGLPGVSLPGNLPLSPPESSTTCK